MYYSFPCPYCGKIFYTFNDSKDQASKILYSGIKQHLISYGEDDKEHTFDEPPEIETNQIYAAVSESSEAPTGGYPLE